MPDEPRSTPHDGQERPDRQRRGDPLSRRSFLRGTAGTLAVVVLQRAFRLDALAQEQEAQGFQFFTPLEAETFEALAGRIWPGDEDDPGAVEAGAVNYVDRALAGSYSDYQSAYRNALFDLEQDVQERFGSRFAELDADRQDVVVAELYDRSPDDDPLRDWVGRQIHTGPQTTFELFRKHVMEGVFCDPVHGGNRDFAGWRVVNYPGAHYVYSAEEQQVFEPLAKPFQSVADL